MTREIVLDTETTGLDPKSGHRIIEIGALEMKNKVLTGEQFHCYINPERDVPDEAFKIHGISTDFLQDKPLFKDIADDFIQFIAGAKLVIHNAPFDIKFLNFELSRLDLPMLELAEAIDTLKIARKKFPGSRVNLDALCKRFKVDNSSRTYHGALMDAALLVEVYVELTGGRQTSFSLSKEQEENQNATEKSSARKGSWVVVLPTTEEKQNHSNFINKILS